MTFDPHSIKGYRWPFLLAMLLFLLVFAYVTCTEQIGPAGVREANQTRREVTPC